MICIATEVRYIVGNWVAGEELVTLGRGSRQLKMEEERLAGVGGSNRGRR